MWGKSLAAALLGLPLTVGIIGLVALLWPGDPHRTTLSWLLVSFPVWIAVMSCTFLFRSGLRAWLWLGGATLLCFVLVHAVKLLGWVGLPA
jgi:hypothetical protein